MACLRFALCLCFVLPSQDIVCVMLLRYCCAFLCVLHFFVCLQCADVLLSLLSLSLSLTASMGDTMLPLLNWTFHFISVGRSKGRDDFLFLIITVNLPSELRMCPWGIVDS